MLASGARPPVRISADGTGNSGENDDARHATITSARSPGTITSAPSSSTFRKLPTFMAATLMSFTSRSMSARPAICRTPSAAATSPVVGRAISSSSGRTYTGRPDAPGFTAAAISSTRSGSARFTMMASSVHFSAASSLRATSTAAPASATLSPFAPTTATTGAARLLARRALRSNSTAASWPVRSVPSTITTSQWRDISAKISTQRASMSARLPSASRARTSAPVRPPRHRSSSSWKRAFISATMGSSAASGPWTTGLKKPIRSACRCSVSASPRATSDLPEPGVVALT